MTAIRGEVRWYMMGLSELEQGVVLLLLLQQGGRRLELGLGTQLLRRLDLRKQFVLLHENLFILLVLEVQCIQLLRKLCSRELGCVRHAGRATAHKRHPERRLAQVAHRDGVRTVEPVHAPHARLGLTMGCTVRVRKHGRVVWRTGHGPLHHVGDTGGAAHGVRRHRGVIGHPWSRRAGHVAAIPSLCPRIPSRLVRGVLVERRPLRGLFRVRAVRHGKMQSSSGAISR